MYFFYSFCAVTVSHLLNYSVRELSLAVTLSCHFFVVVKVWFMQCAVEIELKTQL